MMRKQFVQKGFSILVVLVLCAAMVPAAGATTPTPLPVMVNGDWTQGTWKDYFSFTLTEPGTVSVVTNYPQACGTLPMIDVPVYNGLDLLLTELAYDCSTSQPGLSVNFSSYSGNADYLSFSFTLEPGTYSIRFVLTLATKTIQDVTPQGSNIGRSWVRVDTSAPKDAAIVLTAVNPPDTAWASVQWLNLAGTQWTDVPGWLGPLDQNEWGFQAHFIDEADLGTGPFRWVVYDKDPRQGGKVWAMTPTFYLPTTGEWLWFTLQQGDKMTAGSAGAASAVLFPDAP